MKKLLLSLFIVGIATKGYSQIFSQDFTSSSNVGDYFSSTPALGQFNNIGTSNVNSTVSITGNALRFTHVNSTAGTASFSRTTDFSGSPTFLAVKFRLAVSGNSTSQQTAASFAVGSGFGTSNSVESNSSIHTRFGVNLTATDGTFVLRDLTTVQNSANLVGPQDIYLFINNTGTSKNYIAPDGSEDGIANGTWELWAGTTKLFDGRTPETPSQSLTDMKFVTNWTTANNGASIDITNIVINDQSVALPIVLKSFTAKANLQNIDLAWATTSEQNNEKFEILRSGDGKTFTKIGEVKGAGTTNAEQLYSFVDQNALPGTNYYKLKQIDFNGKNTISDVVAVKSNVKANKFTVNANDAGNLKVGIFAANEGAGTLTIFDLSGKKVASHNVNLNKGFNNFVMQFTVSKGLYIAKLNVGNENLSQKFVK